MCSPRSSFKHCQGLLILSSYLKAFIFQKFAKVCYSVFTKHSSFESLLNLCKAYIFHEFAEGLLSICVCWIIKILLWIKRLYFSAISLENMCNSQCTKERFSSMLFIWKNCSTGLQWCHSCHWNQHPQPNYWKSYWRELQTHSTEGLDDSLETCEIERCSVSEPVFKHLSLWPGGHQSCPQGTFPWH